MSSWTDNPEKRRELRRRIEAGVKAGAARAIEEHRRMGLPIVVWRDGCVVIVPADEIKIERARQ